MDETDEAYQEIFERIVPDVLELFKLKAQDHRGAPHFLLLGTKGQFAELNKKFWKLYNAIWQDRSLAGEQPIEIAKDMIGHLFLMLYCLDEELRRDPQHAFVETLEDLGSSEEVIKAARGPMAPVDSEFGLQQ